MCSFALLLLLLAEAPAGPQTAPAPATALAPAATPAPVPSGDVVVLRNTVRWWEDPAYDRHISLVVKDADLNGAIDALAKAAKLNLVASGGTKARKKVTLNLRDAPLRDVMQALAGLYGLEWFKTGEVHTLTYVSSTASTVKAQKVTPSYYRQPNLPRLPALPRRTYSRRVRVVR